MAVRVRRNGRVLCAATHPSERGDTYLDDGLHYRLSVGEWWWANEIPADVEPDQFYLDGSRIEFAFSTHPCG